MFLALAIFITAKGKSFTAMCASESFYSRHLSQLLYCKLNIINMEENMVWKEDKI